MCCYRDFQWRGLVPRDARLVVPKAENRTVTILTIRSLLGCYLIYFFLSSLQYLKVTIWCWVPICCTALVNTDQRGSARSAGGLWFKRPSQKTQDVMRSGDLSLSKNALHLLAWLQSERKRERAGERNVLYQLCMPGQGRVTCDKGGNTPRAHTWCQPCHSLWDCININLC